MTEEEVLVDSKAFQEHYDLQDTDMTFYVDMIVKDIALAFWADWRVLAAAGLSGARKVYLNSLVVEDPGFEMSAVRLIGEFPNKLEQGSDPYDMKIGFANSNKKKFKYNKEGQVTGWYLTIPFRYGTPGAIGEGFTDILTDEVYRKVKEEGHLKIKDLPTEFQVKGERKAILDKSGNILFKKYEHKTAQLAGLTKISNTYEGATQSQYMTFRRVSDKSSPMSWIHPGFEARNFGDKAWAAFDGDSVITNSTESFLDSLGL